MTKFMRIKEFINKINSRILKDYSTITNPDIVYFKQCSTLRAYTIIHYDKFSGILSGDNNALWTGIFIDSHFSTFDNKNLELVQQMELLSKKEFATFKQLITQ